MTYERAKELFNKSNEVAFSIIEQAIHDMTKDEFLKQIPIIEPHTRLVAQLYGWCFIVSKDGDYTKYYQCYSLGQYVFRDEKQFSSN